MAAAFKLAFHEGPDDFPGRAKAQYPAAHSQHVGIIVLTAHLGREHIIAECATDALDFVGSNGNANAGAAEHNATVGIATYDITANLFGNIRVINRIGTEGANIFYLNIAVFLQNHLDFFFELDSAVIAANRYFHEIPAFHTY